MTRVKCTEAEAKDWMRHCANSSRDLADETALWHGGCDDPLHPSGPQVFRDYEDFIDRVARPLVEADGDDEVAIQAAMALYRKESPYSLCISMVMLQNRIIALVELGEKAMRQVDAAYERVTNLERDRRHPYGEIAENLDDHCEECGHTRTRHDGRDSSCAGCPGQHPFSVGKSGA